MIVHWSVQVTVEHEYEVPKGCAINTITVERVINGDDEICDAHWATHKAIEEVRAQYHIPGSNTLHAKEINVKECD